MKYPEIAWIGLKPYEDPPRAPIGKIREVQEDGFLGIPVRYRFIPNDDMVTEKRMGEIAATFKNHRLYSGSSWKIFVTSNGKIWLGIRTYVYEVELDYHLEVSYEEAIYLVENGKIVFGFHVTDYMDGLTKYKKPNEEKKIMSDTIYSIEFGEIKEHKMPTHWYRTRKEAETALNDSKKKRIAEIRKELAELEAEIDEG